MMRWQETRQRHGMRLERSPLSRREPALHRVERLEERIAELERALDMLQEELREMHRRRE